MAREMKKITEGRVRDRGKMWFPQLVDKRKNVLQLYIFVCKVCVVTKRLQFMFINTGKSIKVHLYWAMKNCGDSPSKLQELIQNIPCHYQVHLHFYNNIIGIHMYIICTYMVCAHVGPTLQMPLCFSMPHTSLHTK